MGAAVFLYQWCLQQNGDEVEGVISICQPDKSRRGSYRMRGQLHGDALQFQGTEFIENTGKWSPHTVELGRPFARIKREGIAIDFAFLTKQFSL